MSGLSCVHRRPATWLAVLVTLLVVGLAPAVNRAASPRRLAFERDGAIWVADLDGAAPKRVAGGQMPEISPDGTRVVYNTVQASGQPAHRQLAVLDIASGTTTILERVPSTNAMAARWSPDGTRLLFDYYVDNDRRIGVVNADGTGFRGVFDGHPDHQRYWAAAWAADGQSFFAEDMEALYHLDLKGAILTQWRVDRIVAHGSMGGDVRLAAAPDGRTLLMDVEMDETERADWDGPPPAIWAVDLAAGTGRRLTPPGLYAWDGAWLDAPDSIVFLSQAAGETRPSVYRMATTGEGNDRRLLVRNARTPSVSR